MATLHALAPGFVRSSRCASIMLFGALVPFAPDALSAVLLMSVASAGGGALYTLVSGEMLTRVPQNSVSTAGGLNTSAQSLMHIIMSPHIGTSITATGSYTVAFVSLSLGVVPGCAAWLFWRPAVDHRS